VPSEDGNRDDDQQRREKAYSMAAQDPECQQPEGAADADHCRVMTRRTEKRAHGVRRCAA
jgi:hypothetical protein